MTAPPVQDPLVQTMAEDILAEYEAPLRLRERGGAYLCTHSMGVVPNSAVVAELSAIGKVAEEGIEVWEDGSWMGWLDRYAEVIGRMVGVRPAQVCPVTNITDGLWRVLSTLRFSGRRRTLLQTGMEFTTQLYATHGMEAFGAQVVTVPADPRHHFVPTEALVEAILKHEPLLVNLSHVAFESGYRHELEPIAAACRKVGAIFCLDAAQTGFVYPLNMAELQCDCLLLQQHKWGCAGTGAACLVATDDFIAQATPGLVGWMSHAETFAFEKGPARFGQTAWRFCGGTPDVPSKARGALAAEKLVDDLGIQAVWAWNQALVTRLEQKLTPVLADQVGKVEVIPQPRRGGWLGLECFTPERARAITLGLKARHILIDSRGSRLRIGPAFYNQEADLDCLTSALRDLLSVG